MDKVFVFIFYSLLVMPSALIYFTDNSEFIRISERRLITPFPKLSINATEDNFRELEDYLDDRMGLREAYQRFYAFVMAKILNHSPTSDVLLGENDWLFHNFDNAKRRFLALDTLSKEGMERQINHFGRQVDYLSREGVQYRALIVPNKATIYSEYYPYDISETKDVFFNRFLEQLPKELRIRFWDVRERFRIEKQQQRLYFKKDTHWNSDGIRVVGNEIYKRTSELYHDLPWPKINYDEYYIDNKNDMGEDLASFLKVSVEEKYRKKIKNLKVKCAKHVDFPYENLTAGHGARYFRCPKQKLKVIFFHDSFFEHAPTYLSEYFNETVFIWSYFDVDKFAELIESYQPDLVIDIMGERVLLHRVSEMDKGAKL